jgi:glycosyltransferase involved in cell wall biosynthesis
MSGRRTLAVVQYASFRSFPVGGISIFVEAVLPYLAETFDLKLVGMGLGERIGEWTTVDVGGRAYDFLPVVSSRPSNFVPDRVRLACALFRHRHALLSAGAIAYYVHMTEAAISLMMLTRDPVVVQVHGLYNLFNFSRFPIARMGVVPWCYERCYPALFSRCAQVFGTGSTADYEAFRRKMRITSGMRIPTCSRDSIFYVRDRELLRSRLGITPEDQVVLFAGRMTPVKNIPMLIQAVRSLENEFPHIRLVLAGDGPLRSEIEQVSTSLRNVQFVGMLHAEELAEWMNVADVLALTSRTEGFPTTVIEALSCGLPVVVTPVNAAHEIVRAGVNGTVAEDFGFEAFTHALRNVLQDTPSRDACAQSVEQYRPSAVAANIIVGLNAALGMRRTNSGRDAVPVP